MPHYLFDLYSAFTDSAFGGSHAGIIYDGEGLTTETMQQIAREVRAPATCFVMSAKDREVGVRFFSTAQEYPMCGHGTLALMTGLVSRGYLDISRGSSDEVTLRTPASSATVTVDHQDDGRIEVMLNLEPAEFEPVSIDKKILRGSLAPGRVISMVRYLWNTQDQISLIWLFPCPHCWAFSRWPRILSRWLTTASRRM